MYQLKLRLRTGSVHENSIFLHNFQSRDFSKLIRVLLCAAFSPFGLHIRGSRLRRGYSYKMWFPCTSKPLDGIWSRNSLASKYLAAPSANKNLLSLSSAGWQLNRILLRAGDVLCRDYCPGDSLYFGGYRQRGDMVQRQWSDSQTWMQFSFFLGGFNRP